MATKKYIYHYTKFITAIEHILPAMKLKSNSLKNMNDPRENQLWSFPGRNVNYPEIYPDTYSEECHIKHQYKLGDEIRKSVQAISFVQNKTGKGFMNEMMWAHYGENHTGICLEIDEQVFREENNITDEKLRPIKYENVRKPFITWDPKCSKQENISRISRRYYKELYLTKSTYWEKEEEKRLIFFDNFDCKNRYFKINNSLKGIYLGLCFPYGFRAAVDTHIKNDETKIYDLYFEQNTIKHLNRKVGDFRPNISRKWNCLNYRNPTLCSHIIKQIAHFIRQ